MGGSFLLFFDFLSLRVLAVVNLLEAVWRGLGPNSLWSAAVDSDGGDLKLSVWYDRMVRWHAGFWGSLCVLHNF